MIVRLLHIITRFSTPIFVYITNDSKNNLETNTNIRKKANDTESLDSFKDVKETEKFNFPISLLLSA